MLRAGERFAVGISQPPLESEDFGDFSGGGRSGRETRLGGDGALPCLREKFVKTEIAHPEDKNQDKESN